MDSDLKAFLIFELGELEFCANLADIQAVKKIGDMIQFSAADAMALRQISFQGRTVPVIDIHGIFGYKCKYKSKDCRIIMLKCGCESMFAFLVDRIKEIFSIENSIFEMNFTAQHTGKHGLIRGTLLFEGRKVMLPDYGGLASEKLYTDKELKTLS